MLTYHIISTIKILIGAIAMILVWFRLTPAQDLLIGVVLMLSGIFLIVWGVSYWILYFIYLNVSHKKLVIISSQCYKISFFIAVYALLNLAMIAREIRNIYIWIAISGFFAGVAILTFRSLNYRFDNISEASTISSQDIK